MPLKKSPRNLDRFHLNKILSRTPHVGTAEEEALGKIIGERKLVERGQAREEEARFLQGVVGKFGTALSIEDLLRKLDSRKGEDVSSAMANFLVRAEHQPKQTFLALNTVLRSNSSIKAKLVVMEILDELAKKSPMVVIVEDSLIDLLSHPDPGIRIASVRTLRSINSRKGINAISVAFDKETLPEVREILKKILTKEE